MSENRVGLLVLQILRSSESSSSLTQQVVEVLREGDAVPRLSQQVIEVLREKSTPISGQSNTVFFVVSA